MQITGSGPSLLSLNGVTKRFGGVTALDHVDFDLRAGEIHALLGENGAGKSTLIKIIGGIHRPDEGTIHIDGRLLRIHGVTDADRLGIRVIHQELSLAPNLSVAENIYMGREPTRLGLISRRTMVRDAEALVASLGLEEIRDVRAGIAGLSVAQQQLVEIARALSCRGRILVLDEPTSSLSVAETDALFVTLKRLRGQGMGIIYISHRLEEIVRLADRVTVLRDGRSVGTQEMSQTATRDLVKLMVGREVKDHYRQLPHRPGNIALSVHDLRNRRIHGVSFDLRYGEALGVAGLVGSGRSELARAIFGIDPLDSGEIRVDGRPVSIRNPRDALAAGIVLVPEDRKGEGLVMVESVAFNLALPWVREWIVPGLPDWRRRRAIVDRAVGGLGIKTGDPECCVDQLSGGNQQKVVVGKWMEHRPKILILDEPTRGVDVGAREEMFGIIGLLVEAGTAVLLISSDLEEVMHTSHRIAVYRDGRIVRTVSAGEIDMHEVMAELTGAKANDIGE